MLAGYGIAHFQVNGCKPSNHEKKAYNIYTVSKFRYEISCGVIVECASVAPAVSHPDSCEARGLVSIRARQVEMEEEESEGEEDAGPCEVFGLLRLPLKPGTASGYVGVQRSASKKRPWQASL